MHFTSGSAHRLNRSSNSSFIVGNKTYILQNGSVKGWYTAKSLCSKQGLELATIPEGHVRAVSEEITGKDQDVHSVWIGLRKSDFYIDLPGSITYFCVENMKHDCSRNIVSIFFIVFAYAIQKHFLRDHKLAHLILPNV